MAAARRPAAGAKPRGGGGGAGKRSAWLAADGSKRWGEAFFLLYTPFWLTLCLGVVVPFKLYERFTELEYLILGLVSTVPAFLIPLFLVGKADSVRSLKDRYWVKANIWIIIFSYVGNYFWTHYFFTVLGASYTSQVRGRRHHLDLHGYIDRILCLQGIDQVPPLRPSVAALTFLPRSRHCRLSASPSLAQEPPSSSLSRSRRPRPRRLGRIQKFLENMVRHHAALQKKTNHQDPCHLSRFMNKQKSYCATLRGTELPHFTCVAIHHQHVMEMPVALQLDFLLGHANRTG